MESGSSSRPIPDAGYRLIVKINSHTFTLSKLPAFIVLDGVNGAGKSTLQGKIQALFAQHNHPLRVTREPGATPVGAHIRKLLLGKETEPPSPECELMLFGADRAEHVQKVILPTLSAHQSVLSDRYYYSTVAFQGYGRGLDRKRIDAVNSLAIGTCLPDLLILLDLDPRIGLKRKAAASGAPEHDRFEHEEAAFQDRMRNGFLELADSIKEPCLVVDASLGADAVYETVRSVIEPALR